MGNESQKPKRGIVAATGAASGVSNNSGVGASTASATGSAEASSSVWGIGESWTTPPSDHPIYAQVGLVAGRWSYVENVLDNIIWNLIGRDHTLTACLTGQFSGTFPRHNAIIAILKARGVLTTELQKRIHSERGSCNNTSAKRNRIVHDPWFLEIGGEVGAHKSWPKEDLRYGIRKIPQSDIDDALKSINERMTEAVQLQIDLARWFA